MYALKSADVLNGLPLTTTCGLSTVAVLKATGEVIAYIYKQTLTHAKKAKNQLKIQATQLMLRHKETFVFCILVRSTAQTLLRPFC